MKISAADFLKQCQHSSKSAYTAFTDLLGLLEEPETRKSARQLLAELQQFCQAEMSEKYHFQFIKHTILDADDNAKDIHLLQFPSTFLPEAWSFTFYEGLVRYPDTEYYDKYLVELGCGIGWVSIALALRYLPKKMIGLDINHKAITCAQLNCFLNGLDDHGELILLDNQRSLLDVISFRESDLLDVFKDHDNYFDKIIGCIPQVLNPEPDIVETLLADSDNDEYLHSLSNYTAQQGYIEDQFGLGLIARAVEQAISLLKANGKLILNLGGRPGCSVLERLMNRRGFTIRRVWQTQVEQAADTDIDTLVGIENCTDHRFEFYMSSNSNIPIDARTAHAYASSGGKIYHSVNVYEAKLQMPDKIKTIYKTIQQMQCERLRSAVDLTYDCVDDGEERYEFLATLSTWLGKLNSFPYEQTSGLSMFRQQVIEYLNYYHHVNFNEQQVLIVPGREELFSNLLTCYQPQLTLVARSIKSMVNCDHLKHLNIIETPNEVEFLCTLIESLKPDCVITELDSFEIQSIQHVEYLLQTCQQQQCLLVIDVSNYVNLSSQAQNIGLYRYLAQNPIPDNLLISSALINNKVYQDYSLNIALTVNTDLRKHLLDAAELTYSRTPVINQRYYANLLEELLYFQRARSLTTDETKIASASDYSLPALARSAQDAFQQPAIRGNHLAFDENTVRLDYGENELPAPAFLKEVLLESFLVRYLANEESSWEQPIRHLLEQRFGLARSIYAKMLFGDGVSSIFAALLRQCAIEKRSLLMPAGCYGYFRAAAEFHDVDLLIIPTSESDDFKLNAEQLKKHLQQQTQAWVFLNAPVVNPTGALYSHEELNNLLAVASTYNATVIMDSIFSGLEFYMTPVWKLNTVVQKFIQSEHGRFILVSGIAKEYAAGGLRFAYAWSHDRDLMINLNKQIHRTTHYTLAYAVHALFEAHINQNGQLMKHLQKQRQQLVCRAQQLTELLQQQGWKVLKPAGGLFLVAKPVLFINKHGLEESEGADLMTQYLFDHCNIAINNATWTGIPGYCRFVLSVAEQEFEKALLRLQDAAGIDRFAV